MNNPTVSDFRKYSEKDISIPSVPARNQSIGFRLGVSRNYAYGQSNPKLRPIVIS